MSPLRINLLGLFSLATLLADFHARYKKVYSKNSLVLQETANLLEWLGVSQAIILGKHLLLEIPVAERYGKLAVFTA